jgi:hypothetical protein
VSARIPVLLVVVAADQSHIRFVNQGRGAERLPGLFTG